MVVCTVANVASMFTGLAAGVLVLGERLPVSGARRAVYAVSWVCVLAGVAGISGVLRAGGAAGGGGKVGPLLPVALTPRSRAKENVGDAE